MTDATSTAAPTRDVVAIGSAIVDVLAQVPEDFLTTQDLAKGSMALVDLARSDALYDAMPSGLEASGGSAANTAAGVGSLGGTVGFVGKVRDDQLGKVFAHDIRAIGVDYVTTPAIEGAATARCLVLVTPDAQRTMCTYLGAAATLEPSDVDPAFVASAEVVYAEGYLWDAPSAKAALARAFDAAHAAGRRTAFTLSDGFCVDRFRDEFIELIDERVDIVFANEVEICSLFEVDDFEAAVDRARVHPGTWAVTRSEKGSVVLAEGERFEVPAQPVDELVDTTGAGDLYAAGFLFGLVRGRSLTDCARIGSIAAAEVISHVGARPLVPLTTLLPADLA
jgi:sugar/nucleoside kinase (ribokinase family)